MDFIARDGADAIVLELNCVQVVDRVTVVEWGFDDFCGQPLVILVNIDGFILFMELRCVKGCCGAVCAEVETPIIFEVELRTTWEECVKSVAVGAG